MTLPLCVICNTKPVMDKHAKTCSTKHSKEYHKRYMREYMRPYMVKYQRQQRKELKGNKK